MLKEVRFHGRGGQGAVTSSQLLAIAAFHSGKHGMAFPNFGVERRGAPVESFTRIDDAPINLRAHVYTPDYVIVLDPTLIGCIDPANGLKEDGLMLINSDKNEKEYEKLYPKKNFRIHTINVTKVALDVIGKPFVNVATLGAFASISGEVTLESLMKGVDQMLEHKGKLAELNRKALEEVHNLCLGKCKV